ncbi:ABC-type glycerol-3-phosphate transport system, substrate-binding protein [Leifsonia sp. 98AMF]|uniref:extracellular solute-binding protein n=1 Tax=unclassified Leifsonia TaxID=2663824 RepID=UPI00087AE3B8|nr:MULTISPECIES: extracellular solute-binding protein [unclassified Leifsonia]SDH07106.1 ABC-type glycerol-3-phosphate transport system, substrate-binding protein [Leifsonia sp. 197AMF]SDJ33108.1 ABC-type glycerol-3-phosphate transport system, substrate-binding protein [Leifsonia sp. 466MF]SDK46824.1 ABC-type glycerol-3-phosphate transport system, substrate-binding protein [Leifsonia sp. 157MF]SDN54110.1 ABC-type glycerol-3-phosphate transport system, substrate-binding protein [Leifsonia sp. 50
MKPTRKLAVITATGLAVAAVLAGCSSSPSSDSANGAVTITIGDRPASSDADNRAYYDKQVKAFEKANPGITLKPVETKWDATTFQALVAGGNLPDVLSVPFTEPQGLIARRQVADLTDVLKSSGLADELNPTVLKVAQADNGHTYAVPTSAYSVGLIYNRDLFAKSGLDPDKPPATWDELRADAKQITEKTGVPGYAQLTTKGQGGWMFTTQTYAFGGTVENAEGTKATFDGTPSQEALKALHEMRWTDGSMPSTALYDLDGMAQAFAGGKVGMFMSAPDQYRASIVTNGMDPKNFGVGGLPQNGGDHGTLSGGSVQVVSPKATADQQKAALKWIRFFYLGPFENQKAAVDQAKAQAADKQPVGLPGLPVLSAEKQETYNGWIKPYVNVPTANFAPYVAVAKDQKIIPEPSSHAQEVYAALDPVVQSVLTDQNADIPALLSQAAKTVQGKLGR